MNLAYEFFDTAIVSQEEYLLKNFWTIADGSKTANVFASVLQSYLKKPKTRVQTMPLSIRHPSNISQTIKISLPEDRNIDDSELKLSQRLYFMVDPNFTLIGLLPCVTTTGQKLRLSPRKLPVIIAKINEVLDDTGLTIHKPLAGNKPDSRTNIFCPITTSNRETILRTAVKSRTHHRKYTACPLA